MGSSRRTHRLARVGARLSVTILGPAAVPSRDLAEVGLAALCLECSSASWLASVASLGSPAVCFPRSRGLGLRELLGKLANPKRAEPSLRSLRSLGPVLERRRAGCCVLDGRVLGVVSCLSGAFSCTCSRASSSHSLDSASLWVSVFLLKAEGPPLERWTQARTSPLRASLPQG